MYVLKAKMIQIQESIDVSNVKAIKLSVTFKQLQYNTAVNSSLVLLQSRVSYWKLKPSSTKKPANNQQN